MRTEHLMKIAGIKPTIQRRAAPRRRRKAPETQEEKMARKRYLRRQPSEGWTDFARSLLYGDRSKYMPHQGKRECARRQIDRGQISRCYNLKTGVTAIGQYLAGVFKVQFDDLVLFERQVAESGGGWTEANPSEWVRGAP